MFFAALIVASTTAAAELQELFVSGVASATTPWVSPGTPLVYRIPALFLSKNGTLIAQCSERMGSSNDESATNLVQKTSVDNGKTWSPIELVVQSHLQVSGHAGMSSAPWALTDDVTGEMFLFYNANSTGNRRCDCGVAAVTSTDNGVSWSSTPTAVYPESSGFYGSSLATGVTLKV
eukprot:gene20166-15373_t